MPYGELFINGKDAYSNWGISMDTASLSALMTPAPAKELVENKSRASDGKSIIKKFRRVDERDLTLTINLSASNEEDFFNRYSSFCTELEKGELNISTKYQPEVLYRTEYLSCTQFTQFMRGIAHFSLRLNEPNPKNRKV